MKWMISFVVALAILILGGLTACFCGKATKKKLKILGSFNLILGSVFAAIFVMFFPVYSEVFAGETFQYGKTALLAIHNTIRLFIVDGEFGIITDYIEKDMGWLYDAYTIFAAVMFVLAPLLTFGVVLSFFKNLSAWRKYLFGYFKTAYIFSELNEKSLALAESIKDGDQKNRRMLVFTGAHERDEEDFEALMERVQELGAICFQKEMPAVNFKVHSKKRECYFFAIAENESENLEQSMKLVELYKDEDHTHLFVFSTRIEGELLLTSLDKGKMKVRRINDVRSLTNRILYEDGEKIFQNAVPEEDGTKRISAVVVGMGRYGTSMVKALTWFCQMDGYRLTIDAFDKDAMAYDKLFVQCPELISEQYNGVVVPGEAQYKIEIHAGMDLDTRAFAEEIEKLGNATYVLVALGSDEENIRASVYLRMLFERKGVKPVIQAIVYNSDSAKVLDRITNYQKQPYDVEFIGDLETSYSEKVILDSELEEEALARHLKWGSEEEFWKYEYNYCSSIASAIHMKAREICGIPGVGKKEEELTLEERSVIENLEHRRWNAYMRSEGYVYSGSTKTSSRNDLGKMHNDLVKFSKLSDEEKRKDSKVGSR